MVYNSLEELGTPIFTLPILSSKDTPLNLWHVVKSDGKNVLVRSDNDSFTVVDPEVLADYIENLNYIINAATKAYNIL